MMSVACTQCHKEHFSSDGKLKACPSCSGTLQLIQSTSVSAAQRQAWRIERAMGKALSEINRAHKALEAAETMGYAKGMAEAAAELEQLYFHHEFFMNALMVTEFLEGYLSEWEDDLSTDARAAS